YGDEFLEEGIVPLLYELSSQDKLPAILFHFNRKGCVDLAFHILKQLELGEKKKRDDDQELKRKRDSKTKGNTTQNENSSEIEEYGPDFTFINRKDQVTSEEFESIIEQARKKMGGNS